MIIGISVWFSAIKGSNMQTLLVAALLVGLSIQWGSSIELLHFLNETI
jgi:hypothetical protein